MPTRRMVLQSLVVSLAARGGPGDGLGHARATQGQNRAGSGRRLERLPYQLVRYRHDKPGRPCLPSRHWQKWRPGGPDSWNVNRE